MPRVILKNFANAISADHISFANPRNPDEPIAPPKIRGTTYFRSEIATQKAMHRTGWRITLA